ncbi:MAG: SCO family protein [Rhodocyclaceae bacterium]|nr:SCO family protein [Rhodocyclaceae bacterium]
MSQLRRRLLVAGLSLSLLGTYLVWRTVSRGPAPAAPVNATGAVGVPPGLTFKSATVLNDDRPLPEFHLEGTSGEVGNAVLSGNWTLVFFGYTYCPDICPTSLTTLAQVKSQLVANGVAPPRVLFISVDGQRDRPDRLAEFVRFFDADFQAAVGSDQALPLARHLGVFYQRHDKGDGSPYSVDHSSAIYLVDPQGRLKAVFSWPHDPATMATEYPKIIAGGT